MMRMKQFIAFCHFLMNAITRTLSDLLPSNPSSRCGQYVNAVSVSYLLTVLAVKNMRENSSSCCDITGDGQTLVGIVNAPESSIVICNPSLIGLI
jgi:hypothetical protein